MTKKKKKYSLFDQNDQKKTKILRLKGEIMVLNSSTGENDLSKIIAPPSLLRD